MAPNTAGIVYPDLFVLMLGIHMAGPHLTPTTFEEGLFQYPPSGGGPTTPHVSFGHHGYFPNADFIGPDDVTLIWWDPTATGPDEQGKTTANGKPAKGMWRYVDAGHRYLPGDVPKTPVGLFRKAGTITVYNRTPAADAYPSYPSPARHGG